MDDSFITIGRRKMDISEIDEIKEIQFAETTLHIGLGTFRDILVEDLSKQ